MYKANDILINLLADLAHNAEKIDNVVDRNKIIHYLDNLFMYYVREIKRIEFTSDKQEYSKEMILLEKECLFRIKYIASEMNQVVGVNTKTDMVSKR